MEHSIRYATIFEHHWYYSEFLLKIQRLVESQNILGGSPTAPLIWPAILLQRCRYLRMFWATKFSTQNIVLLQATSPHGPKPFYKDAFKEYTGK